MGFVDRTKKFSPEDAVYHRQLGEQKRASASGLDAGPITAATCEQELRQRAVRLGHNFGESAALVEYILRLERRIAALESPAPYLHNLEKRTR
ncbi:MAG: hypothetical protein ACE14M_11025 [Terriglobales bacterium]